MLTGTERYMEPRALQYRLKRYTEDCGLEGVHFPEGEPALRLPGLRREVKPRRGYGAPKREHPALAAPGK